MNNITVCAENSFELQASNNNLMAWCDEKVKSLEKEAEEFADTIVCATNFGTNTKNMKASLNRMQRKIRYYHKIKKAIEAGYTIIPAAFWGNTLAVRVKDNGIPKSSFATPDNLPAGEGKYVDDRCFAEYVQEDNGKGGKRNVLVSATYDEAIDYPLIACKVKLIEAAQKAMGFLVFDQIMVCGGNADPMIAGQIRRPDGQNMNFLIAWWLDTQSI